MIRCVFSIFGFLYMLCATLSANVALSSTYTITSNWNTGYVAAVNITNSSSQEISSWTASFALPQGQVINCLWNGTYSQSSQNITVTNTSSNGIIQPGETLTWGFQVANPNMTSSALSNLSASGVPVTATGGLALSASYTVDTVWATAYHTKVTLINNTNSSVTSWTATFSLPQGYVLSSYLENGIFSVNGQTVTVSNLSSNGSIQPGGSVTFGMIINMPNAAPTVINNLQAYANGSSPAPTTLASPVLQPISNQSGANQYTISWNSVSGAAAYLLKESATSNFTNAVTLYNGPNTTMQVTGKAPGTYYYDVIATAGNVMSAPSNQQMTTVSQSAPPPSPSTGIEHAAWYIDWTSWFNGPPFVIPSNVNMINIFVGELAFASDGTPTLDGFGNLTLPQIDAFTAYCHSQVPPISVKVSIGGSGGMYDRCWDRLTTSNVQAFAQGMADFCHKHGLDGVDFDYEEYASAAQESLVGTLIKSFKAIDPSLQTSLCTNAAFGPNAPWQGVVKTILDAATIAPGNCAVDRLYIMSYYDPIQNEEAWIVGSDGNGGWANWLIQNYGFTRARVSVGIDDFDAHAYDPVQFANWAASQGFSTSHWAFDPAHP